MSSRNNKTANPIPPMNEGFTQGGDLTLRSTDGINFSVHSLFLSFASPVFSDLLQTVNRNEAIQISEKAEVLALMLNFIYPKPPPIISSMDLLSNALRVANKYQLENMKGRLREQLTRVDSPVSVFNNPMSVLYVASLHELTAEAQLAANLASESCGFGKEEDLKKLLDASPTPATTALVNLTGIPLVKTRVLIDVLFHFERSPMTLHDNSDLINTLLCNHCKGIYRRARRQSAPEWQARWAHWIFEQVKDRPFAEWKDYFSHSHFNQSFYQASLPAKFCAYEFCNTVPTCECAGTVNRSAAKFQPWADGVYGSLKSRLSFIAELEAQIHNPDSGSKKV